MDSHLGLNKTKLDTFKNKYPVFMSWHHASTQGKYKPIEGQVKHPIQAWKEDNPDVDTSNFEELQKELLYLEEQGRMLNTTKEFADKSTKLISPEDLEKNRAVRNFMEGVFQYYLEVLFLVFKKNFKKEKKN